MSKGGVNKPRRPGSEPPDAPPPQKPSASEDLKLDERIEAIERRLSKETGLRDQCSNCKTGDRGHYCDHRPMRFYGAMQGCKEHVIKQKCDGSGWLNRRSLKTCLCSGCGNCGHGTRREDNG